IRWAPWQSTLSVGQASKPWASNQILATPRVAKTNLEVNSYHIPHFSGDCVTSLKQEQASQQPQMGSCPVRYFGAAIHPRLQTCRCRGLRNKSLPIRNEQMTRFPLDARGLGGGPVIGARQSFRGLLQHECRSHP